MMTVRSAEGGGFRPGPTFKNSERRWNTEKHRAMLGYHASIVNRYADTPSRRVHNIRGFLSDKEYITKFIIDNVVEKKDEDLEDSYCLKPTGYYPSENASDEEIQQVNALFDKYYGSVLCSRDDDAEMTFRLWPNMNTHLTRTKVIDWDAYWFRKKAIYRGITYDTAERVIRHHIKEAKKDLSSRSNNELLLVHVVQLILSSSMDVEDVRTMLSQTDRMQLMDHLSTKVAKEDLMTETVDGRLTWNYDEIRKRVREWRKKRLFSNEQAHAAHPRDKPRRILLSLLEDSKQAKDLDDDREGVNYVVNPFPYVSTTPATSYNILINLAVMETFIQRRAEEGEVFPAKIVLPKNWEQSVSKDGIYFDKMETADQERDFLGAFVLWYVHECPETSDSSESKSTDDRDIKAEFHIHDTFMPVIPMLLFRNPVTEKDVDPLNPVLGRYQLFTLDGKKAYFGSHSPRRRFIYHELRQVMMHLHNPDSRWYLYKDVKETEREVWYVSMKSPAALFDDYFPGKLTTYDDDPNKVYTKFMSELIYEDRLQPCTLKYPDQSLSYGTGNDVSASKAPYYSSSIKMVPYTWDDFSQHDNQPPELLDANGPGENIAEQEDVEKMMEFWGFPVNDNNNDANETDESESQSESDSTENIHSEYGSKRNTNQEGGRKASYQIKKGLPAPMKKANTKTKQSAAPSGPADDDNYTNKATNKRKQHTEDEEKKDKKKTSKDSRGKSSKRTIAQDRSNDKNDNYSSISMTMTTKNADPKPKKKRNRKETGSGEGHGDGGNHDNYVLGVHMAHDALTRMMKEHLSDTDFPDKQIALQATAYFARDFAFRPPGSKCEIPLREMYMHHERAVDRRTLGEKRYLNTRDGQLYSMGDIKVEESSQKIMLVRQVHEKESPASWLILSFSSANLTQAVLSDAHASARKDEINITTIINSPTTMGSVLHVHDPPRSKVFLDPRLLHYADVPCSGLGGKSSNSKKGDDNDSSTADRTNIHTSECDRSPNPYDLIVRDGRRDFDVMWTDMMSIDDYPVNLLMLDATFASLSSGKLTRGGDLYVATPIPYSRGDLKYHALSLLAQCFEGFEALPVPVIHPKPYSWIKCRAFDPAKLASVHGNVSRFFDGVRESFIKGTQDSCGVFECVSKNEQKTSQRVFPVPADHEKLIHSAFVNYIATRVGMMETVANVIVKNASDKPSARTYVSDIIKPAVKRAMKFDLSSLGSPAEVELKMRRMYNFNTVFPMMTVAGSITSLFNMEQNKEFKVPYNKFRHDYEGRCHWGQFKLLASEIDLFVRCRRKFGPQTCYVMVYAGAANGLHLPVLADLFPEVVILAYDGAKFDRSVFRHSRIRVFEGRRGFVTDAALPSIDKQARREERNMLRSQRGWTRARRLFVSDIRISPDNASVHADMVNQARWGISLRCHVMMLKFRLPYPSSVWEPPRVDAARDFGMSPSSLASITPPPPDPSIVRSSYLYLKGMIQPQVFAPMHSTETRLIVGMDSSDDVHPTRRFSLNWYNIHAYETDMSTLNAVSRRFIVADSVPLDLYVRTFDRGIECLSLFNLIRAMIFPDAPLKSESLQFLTPRDVEQLRDAPQDQIVATLSVLKHIRDEMYEATGRTLSSCTVDTLAKHIRKKQGAMNSAEKFLITTWFDYEKKKLKVNNMISDKRGLV